MGDDGAKKTERVNKWLLSLVALMIGAFLTFVGAFVTDRFAAVEEQEQGRTTFLREQRVLAYSQLVTSMTRSQRSIESLASTLLNTADDRDYFLTHVDAVNASMVALEEADGQVAIIGSKDIAQASRSALERYREVYEAVYYRWFDHVDDPQTSRYELGLHWREIVTCETSQQIDAVTAFAQLDLGAAIESSYTMSSCEEIE